MTKTSNCPFEHSAPLTYAFCNLHKGQIVSECTGGPLRTLFFETLEKQPCKQKTL